MLSIPQRFATAVQHHEAGRLGEAEELYRGILGEAPRHPHALHLLGLVAYQTGRHAEAVELIGQALAVHGPHPVFYSNLGAVYLEVGRLDDTIATCREALRLQPALPNAHNNMGVALMRQGRYDEAAPAFREAIRRQPAHVDARCNLGAVLHRQGRLHEALPLLQETVRFAPGHAQAQNDLGGVLLACDRPEDAAAHLLEAVRLRPTFAEAHSNLGLALRELGRLDESMACFRESLRLNPAYAGAHNNLAYTLEFQGKIDAARRAFQEALRLDPGNARALAGLSGLAAHGHYQVGDEEVRRMQALAARSDLPLDDLGRLHFALARTRDQAGAHDEAFEHYRRGNELRKEYVRSRGAVFDPAQHRRAVDRLIAAYSPAYFARVASFGLDTEVPIFVVGMMRSGTTLAEQILASHPRVHGASELREIGNLTGGLPAQLRATEAYPECVARLDAAVVRALAEAHLKMLQRRGGAATRVVDKMPFNYLHLGLILTLFPKAHIVHCRRDAVDTCLSCFFQNFGEPHGFTLDLAHLGAYYREYERLMAHWQRVLPAPIFDLCYEELTADQEAVSRRLIAHCGLAWHERCLRFNETERAVRTASTLQVRKPIYRSAVGRWKRYEKHLGALLEALGERMLTIPQRLALAVEHHEAGRRAEAEALYRSVLAEAPQHAHALHLMGVLAHQAGRREEAIRLIWRALAAHGPHPVFHSNLAAVYLADGRLHEAERHCREALRLKPDLADAHTNLGTVLERQGQLQEAARAFGEAVELNRLNADGARGNPGPYGARPAMVQGQGQLPVVLAHLREAVRLGPTNEQAQHDLGLVLIAGGQPAEAVAPLREAIRLKPDFSQAHSNLGTALHHLDQVAEAMQCYREALRVDPENARARNNLGSMLEYRGQIEDALGEFQETLRRDPNNAQAIFVLSELAAAGHYRFADQELRRIGELAESADRGIDDRCHLHFALALVHDKNGACGQAFAHALRANELRQEIDRKCGMVFDPAAHRRYVDRLIAAFTPAYFERVCSFGAASELPIFVVGLMRSGTTLAEHILASHPQVHGAGELRDVGVMVGGVARRMGGVLEYPECMAHLDATLAGTLAQEYLQTLGRIGGTASRVVDKMPINFLGLGVIATLFPRARIVHCSRDPVDTCLSCFFRNFAGPFPFTFDLGHMGAYYREYQRLMAHWAQALPMPIFELRYEELTGDQEAVSRRLLAFCGLEWDERCLRFNETQRAVRTASSLQVRKPMYRSAVGRWRRYEAHLKPLFNGLAGHVLD